MCQGKQCFVITVCHKYWRPSGLFLSSMLFILYTNSFTADQRDCHVFKYADDTAVLGKITNSDESCYRQEVTDVVD